MSVDVTNPVDSEPDEKAATEAEALDAKRKAELEKIRLEAKFSPEQLAELDAKRAAIKKKNADQNAAIKKKSAPADAKLQDKNIDNSKNLTKRTKIIIALSGPVVATLYLLAWAFPAFSAFIAALIIGVAISTVSYFAYKLYLKGTETADQLYIKGTETTERLNNIATNFEEEYLPEILVQAGQTLGTVKQTAESATATLKQFPKDVSDIRKDLKETREDLSQAVTKGLTMFSEVFVSTETQVEKITLAARQSALRNTYEQNLVALNSVQALRTKSRDNCMAGILPGSKKTAYITKYNGSSLICRFLDDNNTLCNIKLPYIEDQRAIETIVSEDKGIILKAINLHIVRADTKATNLSRLPRTAASQPVTTDSSEKLAEVSISSEPIDTATITCSKSLARASR